MCVEFGRKSATCTCDHHVETSVSLGLQGNKAATPQPAPKGDGPEIYPLVVDDIKARVEMGRKKYGTTLRADNGHDPLWDAYQEALDLAMYLRQAIVEKEV